MPVRHIEQYSDVQPLAEGTRDVVAGRYQLLKAKLLPVGPTSSVSDDSSEGGGWCVLKGFVGGNERGLRRELRTLARLNHPNVVAVQVNGEGREGEGG